MELGEELLDSRARDRRIGAAHIQFHAIAGGDNRRFVMDVVWRQRSQRSVDSFGREIETLAQLNGRGAMAHADQEQLHARTDGSL